MNVLVTGAGGFIGSNLCAALKNRQDGSGKAGAERLFEYHADTPVSVLEQYCAQADFVFHLAGVNRSDDPKALEDGNPDALKPVLDALRRTCRRVPVMLASSVQAALTGRYDGPYGRGKRACEELTFAYGRETGAAVFVYRLPNVFGKWSKPDYNSAVATFCHRAAHDLPLCVNAAEEPLELLYIDDLVRELLTLPTGGGHRCFYDGAAPVPDEKGDFYYVPGTFTTTVGELAACIDGFRDRPGTPVVPELPQNSLVRRLYGTYLSFLPPEKVALSPDVHGDRRGSFTELLRAGSGGQLSVNVTAPGGVRGGHWHHSKWELFFVVAGHGKIVQRRRGGTETAETEVCGEWPQAVRILPGYIHHLVNLSDTQPLITVIWTSDPYDPDDSDTYREKEEQA